MRNVSRCSGLSMLAADETHTKRLSPMNVTKPEESPTDPASYRYPIESVENAARTLLMLRSRSSIRIVDVADELGAARSTAHRMVSTLAQAGLLERHPTDKSFVAGPALMQLAKALTSKGDIRTEIEPTLAWLVKQTGETAHYLVLKEDQALFLACVESPHIIRAVSRVGHRLPAHITSAGKCLLAALAPEEVDRMFSGERSWATGTDLAIHDRDHLLAELAQISNRGWALNNEESEPGVIGVSAVVRGGQGEVLGAVTVSGPAERMRPRITEIVASLRTATEDFRLHRG